LILALAAFLRLYRLGDYPPLNADEAAIGYNALSLIQTGKDEHGNSWPIHFKSFGDFKPGGYFYIVLPFVKLLGLNEWAVRLPSALMATATIYLVYLLAKLLWRDEVLGLIWAFVLAISPWHLHFSRGGWESNSALFCITLGLYFFFLALKTKKTIQYSLFTVHSIFAMYIYHSARVVVPAMVLGLAFFNWRILWQKRKQLILPIFLGILFLIPLTVSFLKGGASARFSGVGLLADPGPLWRVNELISHHSSPGVPIAFYIRCVHNKLVGYGVAFAQKYFSHFNGRFLFIDGDEVPRSRVPDMGVMYLFEFGFLVLGVWFWLRGKKQYKYLPFLWLAAAPLASAMTFQAPSALRSLAMVIPLTFFTTYGIINIIKLVNSLIINKLIVVLIILSYIWGIFYWWNQYFVHYFKRYPSAWPDFRPTANWLKENGAKYNKICIKGNFDQPYILTLFYLKYPPEEIQEEIRLTPADKFGFSTVRHFGKYYFGDCPRDAKIVKP